jgi:hypothetical protein
MAYEGQGAVQAEIISGKGSVPRGVAVAAILIFIYCGVRVISLIVGFIYAILFHSDINIASVIINLIWTAAFLAAGVDVLRCRKGGFLWGIILSLLIMGATAVISAVLGLDIVNLAMLPLLTATVVLLVINRKRFTQPNKPLTAYFKKGKGVQENVRG